MDPIDRADQVERYRERVKLYGASSLALGWGEDTRQDVRFSVLAEAVLEKPNSSVLDVGCGLAQFFDFLRASGWTGRYTGIDIVPEFAAATAERLPDVDIRLGDIDDVAPDERWDVVVASGIFNARLASGANLEYIERTLASMRAHATRAVSVDFLASDVDYTQPGAWHTDPTWAFWTARVLSRRVVVRCDYMPYEFAVTIFADDSVTPRRVFGGWAPVPGVARRRRDP